MRSNKINSLQSPPAPKTGFSHSLALEPTAPMAARALRTSSVARRLIASVRPHYGGVRTVIIDVARVEVFLATRPGSDVIHLGTGVWSQAFAFRRAGHDYVIRFG